MRWETDSSTHSEVVDMPVWDSRASMRMEPPPALRILNGASGRAAYGPAR